MMFTPVTFYSYYPRMRLNDIIICVEEVVWCNFFFNQHKETYSNSSIKQLGLFYAYWRTMFLFCTHVVDELCVFFIWCSYFLLVKIKPFKFLEERNAMQSARICYIFGVNKWCVKWSCFHGWNLIHIAN